MTLDACAPPVGFEQVPVGYGSQLRTLPSTAVSPRPSGGRAMGSLPSSCLVLSCPVLSGSVSWRLLGAALGAWFVLGSAEPVLCLGCVAGCVVWPALVPLALLCWCAPALSGFLLSSSSLVTVLIEKKSPGVQGLGAAGLVFLGSGADLGARGTAPWDGT